MPKCYDCIFWLNGCICGKVTQWDFPIECKEFESVLPDDLVELVKSVERTITRKVLEARLRDRRAEKN